MKKLFIPVIAGGLLLCPLASIAQQDKDYITVIRSISPEMGGVLADINNTKQEACGKGFSDPELRHIVIADNTYYELLSELTKDIHARETAEYQRRVKNTWNKCNENNMQEADRK